MVEPAIKESSASPFHKMHLPAFEDKLDEDVINLNNVVAF